MTNFGFFLNPHRLGLAGCLDKMADLSLRFNCGQFPSPKFRVAQTVYTAGCFFVSYSIRLKFRGSRSVPCPNPSNRYTPSVPSCPTQARPVSFGNINQMIPNTPEKFVATSSLHTLSVSTVPVKRVFPRAT